MCSLYFINSLGLQCKTKRGSIGHSNHSVPKLCDWDGHLGCEEGGPDLGVRFHAKLPSWGKSHHELYISVFLVAFSVEDADKLVSICPFCAFY